MIPIEETASGCSFKIRVTPKARKRSLGGEHDGALKIAVTAPPEDGKANAAVIAAIAKWLSTSKSKIEIITGHTARIKTIHVSGITAVVLRQSIEPS